MGRDGIRGFAYVRLDAVGGLDVRFGVMLDY